jgi:hypothetical protein
MGPIQVVVEDGNNLVLEVTPTPNTTVILDRGIAGPVGPMGDGDVDGPASSTDNAVARFDGTTGKLIQNSVVTIADSTGNMAGVGTLGVGAITTSGALTYGGVTLNNAVTGTGSMVLSNSPTLVTPALGTPASGVVTNLTGTASININGTVGATTASTGAFTDLSASGAVTLSGATANGVAFANGSKVLTTGSALTFDGSNLGIGTSSPGSKLDVVQAGAATVVAFGKTNVAQFLLGFNGTSNNYLDGDNNIFRSGNGTEGMRLTSTGLGIGTSSPGAKLDVVGAAASVGFRVRGGGNSGVNILDIADAGGAGQFVLNASGNLGIGTSSPVTKLDVFGGRIQHTLAGGGVQLVLGNSFNAVSLGSIQNANTDADLGFYTNTSTERMRLDSSGNLGLGVTPKFVGGYTAFEVKDAALASSGGSDLELSANAYFNSGWKYRNTFAASLYEQYNGSHAWFTAPSGTAGNAISFTQAMTLDASGNLGLGATSITPVFGRTVSIYNAAAGGTLELGGSTITTRLYASEGASAAGVGTTTNTAFQFITNNTERARIDSSGNFLVGTTSGSARLNVTQASGDAITVNTSGGGTGYVYVSGTTTGTPGYFQTSSGLAGQITCSGTTTIYSITSDYRLKTVIGPVSDAGKRIDSLQPVEYTWNNNGDRTRGFLAHQFQEVYASSVSGTKDAVDAEGKPVYQSMQASTSEVIADLVAEIQSLRQRLAAANI